MIRWLVSVPVWGERYVEVFCATALPALEAAILAVRADRSVDARLVVHTNPDAGQRITMSATQIPVEVRPLPAGVRDFDCLSQAHRDVIHMACRDDVVVFLTADLVISERGLVACADALVSPKRLVLCAGVRALQEGRVPSTSSAADLMRWAWENRHPITEASTWPHGDAADLSRVYFEQDGRVAGRLALPHPLAVRVDGRRLRFAPTVDANLMQCFHQNELHVITNLERLALVELSPRDKAYQSAGRRMDDRLHEGAVRVSDPLQRWCMGHRVQLVGAPGDAGDADVMKEMLK